jgi:hypothetical protein
MAASDEEMVVYMGIRQSFESTPINGNSMSSGLNQFTPALIGTFDLLRAAQNALKMLNEHRAAKALQAAKAAQKEANAATAASAVDGH